MHNRWWLRRQSSNIMDLNIQNRLTYVLLRDRQVAHNINSFKRFLSCNKNECAPETQETPSILQWSDKIQWISYNRKGGVVMVQYDDLHLLN